MFEYFVSLGSACPIASSMQKYGIRSFAGPFDWLITGEFSWVLHHIDTDFKDFLLQENLESFDEKPLHFRDKLSGFIFLHEELPFADEYKALKNKYDKRIDTFLKNSKKRVCYLRRINNEQEIAYIEENKEYIQTVIGRYNTESEVVFICDDVLFIPSSFPFKIFKTKGIWSGRSRSALRGYFDNAEEFLMFCGKNYSGENFIKNLIYDYKTEIPRINLLERRYKTLAKLVSFEFKENILGKSVIIYGAGVIGTELYRRIKEHTKVKCFIDRKKAGENFDDVAIISVEDLQYVCGTKIIISAVYDLENIKNNLVGKCREEDIVSLDDLLGLEI